MDFPEKDELLSRYEEYTNEELLQILKNKSHYQNVAVEAAAEIARERGLNPEAISEESAPLRSRLFPEFNSAEACIKILKSVQRILYFVALIPLLTGALAFTDGYPSLGIAYVFTSVMWAGIVFLAVKRKRHRMTLLLFLLLVFLLMMRYMAAGLPVNTGLVDWVIGSLVLLLLIYLIAFFGRLIHNCGRHSNE